MISKKDKVNCILAKIFLIQAIRIIKVQNKKIKMRFLIFKRIPNITSKWNMKKSTLYGRLLVATKDSRNKLKTAIVNTTVLSAKIYTKDLTMSISNFWINCSTF